MYFISKALIVGPLKSGSGGTLDQQRQLLEDIRAVAEVHLFLNLLMPFLLLHEDNSYLTFVPCLSLPYAYSESIQVLNACMRIVISIAQVNTMSAA